MTEAQLKDKVVTDIKNGDKNKAVKVRGVFISVIETLFDLVSSLTSGATAGIPAYSAAATYAIDDLVISVDNKIWKSKQNSNLNQATVEGAWWTEISPATLLAPINIDSPFAPENSIIAIGDTFKKAFEKLQGQISSINTSGGVEVAFQNTLIVSVTHNLNRYVGVSIIDASGWVCESKIRHLNKNSFEVRFANFETGTLIYY